MTGRWSSVYICMAVALWTSLGAAQQLLEDAPELRGIDITEHLGESIPLELIFQDESGQDVRLADYFDGEVPVILTLAYYECPMLCTFVLNGLRSAVGQVKREPGTEFRMVTVSIDPEEDATLAAAKKDRYLDGLDRAQFDPAWSFLVGDQKAISALADAVGFRYFYDEKQDEFAHPAMITIATGNGNISRYLYGIEYSPTDLNLAILEAAQGKIGSIIDRLVLFCYHYDPAGKKYAIMAVNTMRVGGGITLFALGLLLAVLWARDRRQSANHCRTR